VHLRGFVNALSDVAKAESIARAVQGVSAVRNTIRVANRPSRA
jgi:osmotically-inducible protein OsmY